MPGHPEGALAVARAAMDAGEFARARAALAPLLDAPTQRVAMLMAELERAEHGDDGRARHWMLRAVRAAHDPAWTADGYVSDRWRPVSPVTGRLDAFQWVTPVAALPSDRTLAADPVMEELAPPVTPPEPVSLPTPQDNSPEAVAPAPSSDEDVAAKPVEALPTEPVPQPASAMPPPVFRPRPAQESSAAPAIIPIVRAPDDPGVDDAIDDWRDPERPGSAQPGGWRGFLSRLVG
jgi:HemY protein